jgi:hypothetical protein
MADTRASCRPWSSGRRVGAPVTAEMVAELRGGGKDFGSKVRDQRSAKKHGEVENHEAHNDTTKKRWVA